MSDFTDAPWLNSPPPPAEITEKLEELNGYINRRIANYERIEEQLDLLFKDVEAGKCWRRFFFSYGGCFCL